MQIRKIAICVVVSICALPAASAVGNEPGKSPSTSIPSRESDPFQLPAREDSNVESTRKYDLKSAIGDTGIKIGIVVGVFLILVILLSKQRVAKSIPQEAVEILGAVPLATKQQVQLIRFGQKLVLVESSANGLKPISEITDPQEVNRMLDIIRPRTQRTQ